MIKTLKEFQYIDEDGKDQGANVRQKAKDITNLLQDESRLREERRTRASMRDRMIRGSGMPEDDVEDENTARRKNQQGANGLAGKRPNRDEDELRRAIEESKKTLAQDRLTAEERDLQQALRLSKEEEEKRIHDVDSSNAAALFDDSNQLSVDFLWLRPYNINPPFAGHRQVPLPATILSRSSIQLLTLLACNPNTLCSHNSHRCNPNSQPLTLTNNKPKQNRRLPKPNSSANSRCSSFSNNKRNSSSSNSNKKSGCANSNFSKCSNSNNSNKISSRRNSPCLLNLQGLGTSFLCLDLDIIIRFLCVRTFF